MGGHCGQRPPDAAIDDAVGLCVHHLSLIHISPSWVNRNLEFTHGYGIIMNPVNEVTAEGQPNFFIKDLPPQSRVPSIEVTRPEIYFGELTTDTIYVGSAREEFSYPSGDENVYTNYEGCLLYTSRCV